MSRSAASALADEPRGDGGWWHAGRRRCAPAPTRLRFLLDGGAPLPDPRSRVAAATASHGPSRVVDHARVPLDRRAAGRACTLRRGASSTSCTSARSRRRARSTRRSTTSTTSSTLGVTARRADAGRRVPRRRAAGATTASTCTRRTTPTAGPTGSSGSSTPATRAGSRVILDVVYNHLGPDGQLPARSFGPYFTDRHRDAVGRRRQLRRRRQRRGAPLLHRQRADVAARLPRRRPAPRRGPRASSTRRRVHLLEQLAAEVDALGGAARPAAGADRRERPQRPAHRAHAARGGGYGLDAQWSDDFHHALHARAHRRAQRLLRGLRRARRPRRRRSSAASSTPAATRRFRGARHGRPPTAACPADASSASSRTTTRSATGRSGERHRAPARRPGRARDRRGAVLTCAVRADAVPGRGVGGAARRSSTSPTTPTPDLGARGPRGPAPRVRARSAGTRRTSPTRRRRRPSQRSQLDWEERDASPTPTCSSGTAR